MIRRSLKFTLIAGIAASLTACFPFSIDINQDFEFEIDIEEDVSEVEAEVFQEDLVDFSKDFADIADSLRSISVETASLELLATDEANAASTLSGKVEISGPEEDAERIVLAEFEDVPVEEGQVIELNLEQDAVDRIQELLKNEQHSFKVYLNGDVDAFPAKLTAKLSMHIVVTITVDATKLGSL